MKFLDVKTDFAFKKVFGSEQSKDILIDLLNAILDFESTKVTDLTIVDPYQIPLLKGMKDSYVDVKAILSDQTKVIIEMQVLNVEGFEKRVLYNAAKLYSTQLKKAQHYASLEPIIALTITDFIMFEDFRKVISYWNVREKDELIQYSDDIELIFVELPKFTKTEEELTTITDKWVYFIKHAGELDVIPTTFTEPHLKYAFQMANTAGLSEEELELQFKRRDFIYFQRGAVEKARHDGRQEGIQEGRDTEKIIIAKHALRQGVDTQIIASITGLRLEDIEQLRQEDESIR